MASGIMEGDFKRVSAQSLECAICLNVFNEPKILSCSHTFCHTCLKRLLESQLDGKKLPCPVCRNVTDVPDGDVSRVQTNIALMSLVDDVKNQQQKCTNCKGNENPDAISYCQDCGKYLCSSCHERHSEWEGFTDHVVHSMMEVSTGKVVLKRRRKCKKHQQEDEEYFCSECRRYVCFRCGVMEHERKGHGMVESAEHEEHLRKNIEELQSKSDTKTASLQKYIEFIQYQKTLLNDTMQNLDGQVVHAYEKAIQNLTQRKELLRENVKDKFKELEKKLDKEEEVNGQQIIHVNAVKELISNGLKVPLEEDALTVHKILCQDLKKMLEMEDPDYDKARRPLKEGEEQTFKIFKGKNELNLGTLVGFKKLESLSDEWMSLNVELSKQGSMACMAVTLDGKIAVGCNEGGLQIFSTDGKQEQALFPGSSILGLGYLSDGRYAVIDNTNTISLYSHTHRKLQVEFESLRSSNFKELYGGFTVDRCNQIIVGYRSDKVIHIYSPDGGKAVKVVQCTEYIPMQIFAMQSHETLVIKGDDHSVRVIDRTGVTKEVTKTGRAHPAVCADDTIIIAWVDETAGLISIELYTEQLDFVKSLITDFKIDISSARVWYYLQACPSGRIAFCTSDKLYIFYQ